MSKWLQTKGIFGRLAEPYPSSVTTVNERLFANAITNGSATATLTSDTTVDVGAFKPEIFVEIQIELRD